MLAVLLVEIQDILLKLDLSYADYSYLFAVVFARICDEANQRYRLRPSSGGAAMRRHLPDADRQRHDGDARGDDSVLHWHLSSLQNPSDLRVGGFPLRIFCLSPLGPMKYTGWQFPNVPHDAVELSPLLG